MWMKVVLLINGVKRRFHFRRMNPLYIQSKAHGSFFHQEFQEFDGPLVDLYAPSCCLFPFCFISVSLLSSRPDPDQLSHLG